jgi:hypothetical protein
MKMKKVSWIDSKTVLSQITEDELPKPCVIDSVGFLVEETDEYITLARERIDSDWRGVIAIPKCCVKEIKDVQDS